MIFLIFPSTNSHYIESIPKQIKNGFWTNALRVLRALADSPIGFPVICEAFNDESEFLEGVITLCIYGLSDKGG